MLFVCRHGAAKSVLAAADLRRMAVERGIEIDAQAAGVEPSEALLASVAAALENEGAASIPTSPARLTRRQWTSAWRVVTFNLEPAELPRIRPDTERWDDIPPVSEDLDAARTIIRRHLEELLGELAEV